MGLEGKRICGQQSSSGDGQGGSMGEVVVAPPAGQWGKAVGWDKGTGVMVTA
jgi:hypothetical protein